MSSTDSVSSEFKANVKRWIEMRADLREARKALKILGHQEKTLNESIKEYMRDHNIDVINVPEGKICYRRTRRKATLTTANIKQGLLAYFQGDADQVGSILKNIQEDLEERESENIAYTPQQKAQKAIS